MAAESTAAPISVALVIDQLTFDRLGPVIGHLSIGLLDYINQITLITPAAAALRLSLGPVRVIHHKQRRWSPWQGGVRDIVHDLGDPLPAVIHAVSSRSFRLAEAIANTTSRPLIGHLLGSEDIRPGVQGVFQRVASVIAGSEPLLLAATNRHLIDHQRISMIRPGLLTEPAPTCFVQQDLVPTILCMSAFEPTTGVDQLIRAAELLVAEKHDLMLFLLSTGRAEKRLRRLVEEANLINYVTFGEPIANWPQAMRAADIFVVPGDVDRVDVRLLHALAAGMAAVTGSMPNSDFVVHEQTALVCPQPTPQTLAAAIRHLLERRNLARDLATRGLEHCKRYHSLSRMAEQTAKVYEQVGARAGA